MKLRSALFAALPVLSLQVTPAHAADWFELGRMKFYTGAEAGVYSGKADLGGRNTIGPFNNTGSDSAFSGFGGVNTGLDYDRYGLNASYRYYGTTGISVRNGGARNYKTDSGAQVLMLSATYKFFVQDRWDIYAGPGVGFAFTDVKTNDGIVRGSATQTNVALQGELGAHYKLDDRLTLTSGLRYVDMGKTSFRLRDSTNAAGGTFDNKLTTAEWFGGLQYSFD